MKLLIIGKTGQLGSQLIKDADRLNYSVLAPSKNRFDIAYNNTFSWLLKDYKPDIVINTAAYHDLKMCEESPLSAFRYNCIAVKNMAKKCNEAKIPFITFSTNYIFDGKMIPNSIDNEYVEERKPNPINMYGVSKLAGEYASLIYDTTTVIRTSVLYGFQGRPNFIDNRIKDSKIMDRIEVDNQQIISSTYAADLSKAILNLIKDKRWGRENGQIYHLVDEGIHTWYDLTRETFNILGIETELVPVNHNGIYNGVRKPIFTPLKNVKAKALGIVLPHWRESLREYLEIKYKDGV